MEKDFWNQTWSEFKPFKLDPSELLELSNPTDKNFLNLIGNIEGKKVLNIGYGNGMLSAYLAKKSASVTEINTSGIAIDNTNRLASFNGLSDRITANKIVATNVVKLKDKYDLITGRAILHHIEPFDNFVDILNDSLPKDGRGLFLENNFGNRLLIFFRNNVAGKYGVPKYGDNEEHPIEPRGIGILKKQI